MRSQRPSAAQAAQYYFTYIDKVPEGDVVEHLEKQIVETCALLGSIDEERASFRYQPDKWSVKQVVGHVADAERVFAYRALAFSRGDEQAIPGMDQELWIDASRFDELPFSTVLADLVAVRESTLTLFRSLSEKQWQRRGTASEMEFQTGAIAWIIAGHELHHRGVLDERYGIGG